MYKVILVDDEIFPAKLLEKYITTYVDGFEVVEIFRDGTDAVKYLTDGGSADVIITDVKMRKMAGTQLAQYIYTMKFDIEVIFVSAYADFEYAKQAMEYDVFGYLLKVVDVKELTDMMRKLKEKLDRKKKVGFDDVEILRECFVENLLLGKFKTREDMYQELAKCALHETEADIKCTVFKIEFVENTDEEKSVFCEGSEKVESSLIGIIKCAINNKHIGCVHSKGNVFYMQIVGNSEEFDVAYLKEIIVDIFRTDVNIKVIISEKIDKIFGMDKSIFSFIEEKIDKNVVETDREKLIKEALNYINKNIGNDLSRDIVAKQVGLTPAYFGRIFKEANGMSFSDYIYKQRMKCAEELLKAGMRTVDVCAKIGVLDERQFRRSFKGYSGMTPAEYRKQLGRTEESTND